MAYLHHTTSAAVMTQGDLWTTPETNICIDRSKKVPCKPSVAIQHSSSTVLFYVAGTSEAIDGSDTELDVTFRIVDADMKPFAGTATSDAAPVNYLLHSMFSQVDMCLGGTLVSQSAMTYGLRSIIESTISYDKPAKILT
ncbi:Insecticidal crystal protein Cry34Ab1 [Frankliniella fusca]|uniref:Insecticidal crystal protein Cry34Ab1 n=1 Tax=Frankliniella fusca TaxID=407009 RepID=A0AAE1LKJ8_9NEOP|nr:Insecticidal crystal protein Cry34Ab1 [Frankliniella fusca]